MKLELKKISIVTVVVALVLLLQSCGDNFTPFDYQDIQSIDHSSSIISYHGRMIDTDSCLVSGWSFWNKIPLTFNVNEADTLKLRFLVKTLTAKTYILVKVDSVEYDFDQQPNVQDTLVFTISNLKKGFHKIEINMYLGFCSFDHCFNLTEIVGFVGAEIDCGTFSKDYVNNVPLIAFVADSWGCKIPENINSSKYTPYSISLAGGTTGTYLGFYPYQYSNVAHNDPTFDGIVINFGVNEYIQNLSDSTMKYDLNNLIAKIRINQPFSKIFIVNKPRNPIADMHFERYGSVMKEVADENVNTYFLDCDSVDLNESCWSAGDPNHLNQQGFIKYSNYIEKFLDKFYK